MSVFFRGVVLERLTMLQYMTPQPHGFSRLLKKKRRKRRRKRRKKEGQGEGREGEEGRKEGRRGGRRRGSCGTWIWDK